MTFRHSMQPRPPEYCTVEPCSNIIASRSCLKIPLFGLYTWSLYVYQIHARRSSVMARWSGILPARLPTKVWRNESNYGNALFIVLFPDRL
jgi:hypothetical protein